MDKDDIPLSPVAGWEIAPISAYRAVMLRLAFLTTQGQRPDEAHHSPRFVLTAAQARELAEALKKYAELTETGGAAGAGVPKH